MELIRFYFGRRLKKHVSIGYTVDDCLNDIIRANVVFSSFVFCRVIEQL